jgi:hypothetical protein
MRNDIPGNGGSVQGRIQDFKLGGGAHLKKLRRAEGGAKIVGVFRVDPPLVLTKLLLVSKNVAIVSRYMNIRLF